ncbi:MAG: polyphosphate kinase 1 [Planctomycetota bacterium]|nr:MAG: polyphosphate kinase 1 [Planctomycetota bacterium]
MEEIDLEQPSLYINRELSQLQFIKRVLAQARNEEHPLLERLRFLTITSSILDEYFEIRVAGVKQRIMYRSTHAGIDNMRPSEVLERISHFAHTLVEEQYQILNDELIPALEKENIHVVRRNAWSPKQAGWVKQYFRQELLPLLQPMGLDPAHPFPRVLNKSLNFIVSLSGKDAFGRKGGVAVVTAPRALPRVIPMPDEVSVAPNDIVFLSSIIHAHVGELFPGMEVKGCYQFRVTRNSDLFVDEEEVDDLMNALEGELQGRNWGDAVRLEVADNCPEEMTQFLMEQFKVGTIDLYQVNGPVNLHRLAEIPSMVSRSDLEFSSFQPALPKALSKQNNLFDALRHDEILLHHPFESFVPVVDFVRQAAADPNVLAIKQTLYRTSSDYALPNALMDAARAGKEVTVVIELRARFDEEANIELANKLQEAGAYVLYGVVGFKTHAKMTLVLRREDGELKRYVHLGTGNYHARTARLYTDYGLLTYDQVLGDDVDLVFQQLTGLGKSMQLRKVLQSPFTLRKTLIAKIEAEAERARRGEAARIICKCNAITEPGVMRALFRASQAGVEIDLIVRGICCLRPGIPGVSENIRVRSIVGRFLEHTRIYYFLNGGAEEIWLASADLMDRNLKRRVETCFPIQKPKLRKKVFREGLQIYLEDNCRAWILQPDGSYERARPAEGEEPRVAQTELLRSISNWEH